MKKIKKRICQLTFETQTGFKTATNLSVSFRIKKTQSASMNEANIAIDGLSTEDINTLTTIASQMFTPQIRRPLVKIVAGYEDNYSEIFSGGLWQAIPSQRPNRKISCIAYSGASIKLKNIDISLVNASLYAVVDSICNALGFKKNVQVPNIQISSFIYKGDGYTAVSELSKYGNFRAYIEDDIVTINEGGVIKGTGRQIINANTGMIGLPEVTDYGCNVKYRMNSFAKCGSQIELKSKIIPMANGLYIILNLEHVGDFRGSDWYTVAECRKIG